MLLEAFGERSHRSVQGPQTSLVCACFPDTYNESGSKEFSLQTLLTAITLK